MGYGCRCLPLYFNYLANITIPFVLALRACLLVLIVFVVLGIGSCLGQSVIKVQWKEKPASPQKEFQFGALAAARHFSDSVQRELIDVGFLQVKESEVIKGDTLTLAIDPGNQFAWKEIGQGNVPERYWKKIGQPGKSYSAPYRWMEKLLRGAEDEGYPFASVRLDSVKVEGDELSGRFFFEDGPLITWDSVAVSGESKTQQKYLQRFSGLVPGTPFSQTALEKSIGRIRRSPYFSLATVPELSFQTKNARPYFNLQDRRINVFDGVIGLIPNQNEPNSMLVTGELNLALYHLGGKGRDVSLQWQRLNVQSQTLEIKAKESFLLGSPLDFQVDFSLLKQDSSFVNRTLQLEFGYRLSDSGYLRFFNKRQSGDLIGSSEQAASLPSALDYRWNQYGVSGTWDWFNDPFFARRGARISGEFSLGNKRIVENTSIPEEVYNEVELSSPQVQGFVRFEKHVFINKFLGLFFGTSAAWMENENLFLNEFYRLGGLKSIRGFNEKFFFADRYAFLNAEQRIFFGENSYLMVFGDLGVLNNSFLSPQIDRPASFGLGINLDTDGGLFSFVFGLGKSNTQPLSLAYARIHFGYLARF